MKRNGNILVVVIMVMVLMLFSTIVFADEGDFVISGLADGDINIKVSDLKDLPTIKKDVVSVDASGDKEYYTVKGVLFSNLLESIGKSQEDLNVIRLIAGDGYSIEVPKQVLNKREILIVYELNGKPLSKKAKPVRVIIPEERAMYWVKNLKRIKVIDIVKTVNIETLSFLETTISEVQKIDYTYYESEDKAVKVSELIKNMGIKTDSRTVAFKAIDGYKKDEKVDIFIDGYIKVTGEHAPMFLSPDLPKGMYVKSLLFSEYGSTAICSLASALKVLDTIEVNGKSGVMLANLISKSRLKKADKYRIITIDGYSVEVSANAMENGVAYIDKKGRIRCSFAELPKKYSVKYLYKIEPVR